MSDIKNYEAIEWALECMNHYSECDIPDEDRVAIAEAKTIISTFITTIESQASELNNCYGNQDKLSKKVTELEEKADLQKLDINRLLLMVDEFKCPSCGEFLENLIESKATGKVKSEKDSLIESQKEEIERYKQALTPNVVYTAIRHYYKQGLFEQDEFGDIENVMDLISRIQEGDKTI